MAALLATACGQRSAWWSAPEATQQSAGRFTGLSAAAPAAHPLSAVSTPRNGSAIQVATLAARRVLLVADADGRAVRMLDAATLAPIANAPVVGKPSQIIVAPDGRAYATLRDANRLVALEASTEGGSTTLAVSAEATTPTEPFGIALAGDDRTLLVTAAWGARVVSFATGQLTPRFEVAVAREPRGVTVTSDGRAIITHAMGSMLTRLELSASLVTGEAPLVHTHSLDGSDAALSGACCGPDFEFLEPRRTTQGFAVVAMGSEVFAPQTLSMTGDGVFGGYGTSNNFAAQQPTIAVIADKNITLRTAAQAFKRRDQRHGFSPGTRRNDCKLPRGAAADERRGALLVSCIGIDEVHLYHAATGPLAQGLVARWRVAEGPVGIALDSTAGDAFVWSELDRTVSVLALPDEPKPRDKLDVLYVPPLESPRAAAALDPLPPEVPQLSAAAARGRSLFHAPDPRIAGDGRACASCHPDGRDDGLSWPTPAGRRQTPMLAGRLRADLAPFGWSGDGKTVAAHLKETFLRLAGHGLAQNDLEDLIAYCLEMDVPTSTPVATQEQVDRGREIFFSEAVGCASCHKGGDGTDGVRHDVGVGAELDTPSLRFIAGTAPYYHDGRYPSLESLLLATRGKMGWAADMPTSDVVALAAFLRTL